MNKASDLVPKIKQLFDTDILSVNIIDGSYDNINQEFLVKTTAGTWIVKILKVDNDPNNTYWWGHELLFGLTHLLSFDIRQSVTNILHEQGSIPVSNFIKIESSINNPLERPYVIIQKVAGDFIIPDTEIERSIMDNPDIAYQLGEHVGRLHQKHYDYFGVLGKIKRPLAEFNQKLHHTIKALSTTRRAQQESKVQQMLPYYLSAALRLPPPLASGLVMLDLWPGQFLVKENRLSALIDTDSYVIAPIELELVIIELWLNNLSKFKEGYFSVKPAWSEYIEEVREVYRFFFYLLYGCPALGLDACIDSKNMFPQHDNLRPRSQSPRPRPKGYWNPRGPGY